MLRDINLIFLGYRVLLFVFFVALSMGKPYTHKALIIIPSVLYLSLSVYLFLYPGQVRLFKSYGDLIFVPALVLLSGQKEAVFALLPPVALYTSRKIFEGMLFFWFSVGFGFYYYGKWGLALLPVMVALFLSSLHPDLVEALRKERFYIRNLRKSYSNLMSDYGKIEKSLSHLEMTGAILDILQKSNSLEEYLKDLKGVFNLKSISIRPMQGNLFKEAMLDRKTCSFHVPVRLQRGEASVIFYLNNPLELYDKEFLKNLERAGKLINLYIEGFEEKPQAKVIAV
ncbi:MAG: hypothetical protein N3D14_05030 [Aquificaceae bacterium]|nr:hypothetical protein [Aquificaceae bacterium]MCX8164740.1 hypothetical protein [Aquificaceae bacterium]